jgi:hypothetical protein
MMALSQETALLVVWIAYTAMAVASLVTVLAWAVRSGQFANQDKARYLPLESGDAGAAPPADGKGGPADVQP